MKANRETATSAAVLQFAFQPLPGQSGVGICDLDAGGSVALQHSSQQGGSAASEGVQNMTARFGDLHHVPASAAGASPSGGFDSGGCRT